MIRLFVSTVGGDTGWIHHAIPVEVGAAGREIRRRDGVLYDDTGDSISRENRYYGELTGLYWVWKNVPLDEGDIVGFCHYNKCLDRRNTDRSAAGRIFARQGGKAWAVREPEAIGAHDYPEDIRLLRESLGQEGAGYPEAFDALYDENGASRRGDKNCPAGNMFYTGRESFDAYCAFLFRVLGRVREAIGDCDRPAYHARYCAFLGERLLGVYLRRNGCAFETLPAQFNENMMLRALRMAGRATRPLRARLGGGSTRLGRKMAARYRSSYGPGTEKQSEAEMRE